MDDDFNASVNFATDFDLDSNALEKIAESGYKRKLARINSNVSQEASKIDAWLQEEESVMRERFNTTLATLRKALAKRGANMRQTVPKVKAAHLTSLALIKSSHDRVQLAKHKLNRHEQEYKKEIAALREEISRVASELSSWLDAEISKIDRVMSEKSDVSVKLREALIAKMAPCNNM